MPYKDIEKRRESGRKSAKKRITKNTSLILKTGKRKPNTLAEYESDPAKIAAKSIRSKLSYQRNKEKVRIRQKNRRKELLDFMQRVALHYGCQNCCSV